MKKLLIVIWGILWVFCISSTSAANLYDRGDGLIYDNYLNITWLQDANLPATNCFGFDLLKESINTDGSMTWGYADAYLHEMNEVSYMGYSDWRLPQKDELHCMFYYNLNGTDGVFPGGDFVSATGHILEFYNLQKSFYWTSTFYDQSCCLVWYLHFNTGLESYMFGLGGNYGHVWPVLDGDVAAPVPIPGTLFLMGSGLIGFAGMRKKVIKS